MVIPSKRRTSPSSATIYAPSGAVTWIYWPLRSRTSEIGHPANFGLGERAKVLVLSVTEGDDTPLKYPHIFQTAELMILNEIDLPRHVEPLHRSSGIREEI